MKTSKAYFNRFMAEFLRWQQLLGLTQYRIVFHHRKLDGNYAVMEVKERGKLAQVSLCTAIEDPAVDEGPEAHAKHEAIHLLIHRLSWLGGSRYITDDDLDEECESLVTRLEKVL